MAGVRDGFLYHVAHYHHLSLTLQPLPNLYLHSGTLFEGRYKAKPVTHHNYLLHLCRYIHANPVKDGMVQHLEEWQYSNYLEWIGKRDGKLVDYQFVDEFFPNKTDYVEFVQDYLLTRQLPDELNYLADG